MKPHRRAIVQAGVAAAALASTGSVLARPRASEFVSRRPPVAERTFQSRAVEALLQRTAARISDPELAWMFENCFPNTLDTTVDFEVIDGKPDTFIITGDIDAMWLRDSTAQVWPYMPLIHEDAELRRLIAGLINRQVKCILIDPYANAFYKDLSRQSRWSNDEPRPAPGVHERKWEVDSLCYFVRLTHDYLERTDDLTVLDADWDRAARLVVSTFRREQRKDGTTGYRFVRVTSRMIDAAPFEGEGLPIRPNGMISSAFRPSDDATIFPFLVPSNLFAALSLRQLARIYASRLSDTAFAAECTSFAAEIEAAVRRDAIAPHLHFGEIYAYEIDGFGTKVYMDDANVPSLMSLAYLDPALADDPVYQRTRAYLLSDHNPYFLRGAAAEGQGSPHTGKDTIWPMGVILRAMTSRSDQEISACLAMLKATHAGTGFMHESFHKDDPTRFTRSWFAWANTLFGELILKIERERPHLLT
ncbi:MAG: glycoside hydrolase family 125 protein [Brevundimonas sp.]